MNRHFLMVLGTAICAASVYYNRDDPGWFMGSIFGVVLGLFFLSDRS